MSSQSIERTECPVHGDTIAYDRVSVATNEGGPFCMVGDCLARPVSRTYIAVDALRDKIEQSWSWTLSEFNAAMEELGR